MIHRLTKEEAADILSKVVGEQIKLEGTFNTRITFQWSVSKSTLDHVEIEFIPVKNDKSP